MSLPGPAHYLVTMMRALLLASSAAIAFSSVQAQSADPPVADRSPRLTRAVAYFDDSIGRVVMIGGQGQPRGQLRDEVWSWTGTRWQLETRDGPPSRAAGGAAYDWRRHVGVVAGGARRTPNDSGFESIAESWEGTPASWRRTTRTDIEPRDHHALVFDDRRGTVLMFGGARFAAPAAWPTDTWEQQANGWTRIATEGPAGRARTAMAYDKRRGHVVLFGGVGAAPISGGTQPFFGDTWVFENSAWRHVSDAGPRGRYAHAMVFDEGAGVVLLYGGAAAHRNAPLADMWQWDGVRWTEIQLSGPTPGFRYQPVMVYDRRRGKTVLYGGSQGDDNATWEWDRQKWTKIGG